MDEFLRNDTYEKKFDELCSCIEEEKSDLGPKLPPQYTR
jgi:hypothetical protein